MIKNPSMLKRFEDDLIRSEPGRSGEQSLELLTAMWKEGVALGVLPPSDLWEGVEVDVRIAGILNSCSKEFDAAMDEKIFLSAFRALLNTLR